MGGELQCHRHDLHFGFIVPITQSERRWARTKLCQRSHEISSNQNLPISSQKNDAIRKHQLYFNNCMIDRLLSMVITLSAT